MAFSLRNIQYYNNYATLRARGVGDDKDYILTLHKNPVRIPGYEYYSDFDIEKRRVMRLNYEDSIKDAADIKQERFANSISRSRSIVMQLGANNPWEYFVTLTLSRNNPFIDAYDLSSVKKKLLSFFSDYSRRSGAKTSFKYLLIPEKHSDGAWHFHGFLMGINPKDLVINENGYLDWVPYSKRFGFVSFGSTKADNDVALGDFASVGKIRNLRRASSYITKYITKDMFGIEGRSAGEHLYYASKGLKKDEIIVKGSVSLGVSYFVERGFNVFQNEFCAKIMVDRDYGLSVVKPWDVTFGMRDRFNLPGMPLELSSLQRLEIRRRNRNIANNLFELHQKYPIVRSSPLSEKDIIEIEKLFASSNKNNIVYEQICLDI